MSDREQLIEELSAAIYGRPGRPPAASVGEMIDLLLAQRSDDGEPLLLLRSQPPEGWLATAGFPKDRYFMADGGDEWLLYAEDDHGAFS